MLGEGLFKGLLSIEVTSREIFIWVVSSGYQLNPAVYSDTLPKQFH